MSPVWKDGAWGPNAWTGTAWESGSLPELNLTLLAVEAQDTASFTLIAEVSVVADDSRTTYTSSGAGIGISRHWGRLAGLRKPAGVVGRVNQTQTRQRQQITGDIVWANEFNGIVDSIQSIARSAAKGKTTLTEINGKFICWQQEAIEYSSSNFIVNDGVEGSVDSIQQPQEIIAVGVSINRNVSIGKFDQRQPASIECSNGEIYRLEVAGIVAEAQEIVKAAAYGSVDAAYEEELLIAIL